MWEREGISAVGPLAQLEYLIGKNKYLFVYQAGKKKSMATRILLCYLAFKNRGKGWEMEANLYVTCKMQLILYHPSFL